MRIVKRILENSTLHRFWALPLSKGFVTYCTIFSTFSILSIAKIRQTFPSVDHLHLCKNDAILCYVKLNILNFLFLCSIDVDLQFQSLQISFPVGKIVPLCPQLWRTCSKLTIPVFHLAWLILLLTGCHSSSKIGNLSGSPIVTSSVVGIFIEA